MNIASMVRGYIPAPRPEDMVYAPIDLAVSLSELLTKRGHKVTYYGPLGTELKKPIKVQTKNLRPLVHNYEEFRDLLGNVALSSHYVPAMWDYMYARDMFEAARKGQYDLLHFHHPEVAMPFASLYPEVPVIYTLHDPIYDWYKEFYEMQLTPNQFFISISNNQRLPAPDLPYVANVYNGIDPDMFAFGEEEHDDYLMFAGRIVPEKGVKEAIQVAQKTDSRLFIIGPVYPEHQDYFDSQIKPHLNEKILYLGFMGREELVRYYQKAKAVLLPVQWEEPFGLTTIEAMACGTPVIAMRRGAMSETIDDGKNGYIVDSLSEMVDAVNRVHLIHSQVCRDHVTEKFSLDKMVDGYEAAYWQVLKKSRSLRLSPLNRVRRIRNQARKNLNIPPPQQKLW